MASSLAAAMMEAEKKCPKCGTERFLSDHQAVFHSVAKHFGPHMWAPIVEQQTGPAAYMVICRGCGYLDLFAVAI